jgi:signal peptidase I
MTTTGTSGTPEQATKPPMGERIMAEVKDWLKFLAWAFPLWFGFTTVVYAAFMIPSESMVPTLQVGDRIAVSKWAYGYSRHSLPFDIGRLLPASQTRLFSNDPERGDIVVFVHPRDGRVMIKRLTGMPGDLVEVREGRLLINGALVERTAPERIARSDNRGIVEEVTRWTEILPGGLAHTIHEFGDDFDLDTYGPTRIPAGQFLMMGDNRDNSRDGRDPTMGLVPFENFIGRADTVIWTTRFCQAEPGLDCGQQRLWRSLAPQPVQGE